jgi:hypothetical protein
VREVVVARRPEVFVRQLSMEEGRKLARISRTARSPVKLLRAIVVLMSAQGQTVHQPAEPPHTSTWMEVIVRCAQIVR